VTVRSRDESFERHLCRFAAVPPQLPAEALDRSPCPSRWVGYSAVLATFEPGDLVALRRYCSPQLRHLFQQPQNQALQIGR